MELNENTKQWHFPLYIFSGEKDPFIDRETLIELTGLPYTTLTRAIEKRKQLMEIKIIRFKGRDYYPLTFGTHFWRLISEKIKL